MSNRKCRRVRPSRLAREHELRSYQMIYDFATFKPIGDSPKLGSLNRTAGAYQARKDWNHAPSDR